MSIAINPERVTSVLLADGEWYPCSDFDLDSYEYVLPHPDPDRDSFLLHGGGQSGICATGFTFTDKDSGNRISGPLTAILAVLEKVSE